MKPGYRGLKHLVHSTRYSLKGLKAAFRYEAAFRQEVVLCVLLLPVAGWIADDLLSWLILVGSCLVVLITELLNTAVENVVDRIGSEKNELSGRAKDIGSAAVMLALMLAVLCWGLLAGQKFFG